RMAEVLAFAEREGIPVDAATATGSRVIRTVQNVTDRGTLGGALVGDRARTAQTQALRATSDRLAERVHPTAVTAEQAGEGARATLQRRIADLDAEADTAYGQLRAMEADPANTRTVRMRVPMTDSSGVTKLEVVSMDMPLPVDLRSVKRALSPIYERMKRQLPITVQRASPGFKAVENVMQSYDYMPASVVDADLSAIKELARGADLPELRTFSQGLAAGVVKELEDAVQAAVAQAGPEATAARNLGRQATARKHRV